MKGKDRRILHFFYSSHRGIFRTLSNISDGNLFSKIVSNFKSINIFAKSSTSDAWQGLACAYVVVTKFIHGFHKTIWSTTTSVKIKLCINSYFNISLSKGWGVKGKTGQRIFSLLWKKVVIIFSSTCFKNHNTY